MPDQNIIPPERRYTVGDRAITIKPLSFFELMALPEGLFSSIARAMPEGTDAVTSAITLELIKGNLPVYIGDILGLSRKEMESIPAEIGINMIADWMELNLTENFLQGAGRAITAGKRISTLTESPNVSSSTVIHTKP